MGYLASSLAIPLPLTKLVETTLMHVQELVHIDHADVLAQMVPVDRETACLLMDNMAANIADPAALAAHVEAAGAMGRPSPPQFAQMGPPMYPENPPAAQYAHVPAHAQHLQQYGSIPVYVKQHGF